MADQVNGPVKPGCTDAVAVPPTVIDEDALMTTTRGDAGVIVCEALAVHPSGLVTVTPYVDVPPALIGTVIDGVV